MFPSVIYTKRVIGYDYVVPVYNMDKKATKILNKNEQDKILDEIPKNSKLTNKHFKNQNHNMNKNSNCNKNGNSQKAHNEIIKHNQLRNDNSSQFICYNCEKSGHMAHKCRNKLSVAPLANLAKEKFIPMIT